MVTKSPTYERIRAMKGSGTAVMPVDLRVGNVVRVDGMKYVVDAKPRVQRTGSVTVEVYSEDNQFDVLSLNKARPVKVLGTIGEVTYTRVGKGQRSDTAYAVRVDGIFLGYVVGRDGGWSAQPERDETVPVESTWNFVYAQPSRKYVTDDLIAEAKTAGVL